MAASAFSHCLATETTDIIVDEEEHLAVQVAAFGSLSHAKNISFPLKYYKTLNTKSRVKE